jgi:signal peptidase I
MASTMVSAMVWASTAAAQTWDWLKGSPTDPQVVTDALQRIQQLTPAESKAEAARLAEREAEFSPWGRQASLLLRGVALSRDTVDPAAVAAGVEAWKMAAKADDPAVRCSAEFLVSNFQHLEVSAVERRAFLWGLRRDRCEGWFLLGEWAWMTRGWLAFRAWFNSCLTPLTNFAIITSLCILYLLVERRNELKAGDLRIVVFLSGVGLLLGLPALQTVVAALNRQVGGAGVLFLWLAFIPGASASWIARTVRGNHFYHGFVVGLLATVLANGTITLHEPLRRVLALTVGEPALYLLGILAAGGLTGLWTGAWAEMVARQESKTAAWRLTLLMSSLGVCAALAWPRTITTTAVCVLAATVAGTLAAGKLGRERVAWAMGSLFSLGLSNLALGFLGHARRRETEAAYPQSILAATLFALALRTATMAIAVGAAPDWLPVQVGDRVLTDNLTTRFLPPSRMSMIVFDDGAVSTKFAALLGLPGETVELRNGMLYVNGAEIRESSTARLSTAADAAPFVTPRGSYAVRFQKLSGEEWLAIPQDRVLGRVAFRYWPLGRIGVVR